MNTSPARVLRALVSLSMLTLTVQNSALLANHESSSADNSQNLAANLRLTEVGWNFREITNTGSSALDLSGLLVLDTLLPGGVRLLPGQSLALVPNAAAFVNQYGGDKLHVQIQPAGFNYADRYAAFRLRTDGAATPFFEFQPASSSAMFEFGSQWEVNDPTGDMASFHVVENWRPVSASPGTYLPFLPTAVDSFNMPTLSPSWNTDDWKLSGEHRRQYSLAWSPGSLTLRLNETSANVSGMARPMPTTPCGLETLVTCNGSQSGTFAGIAHRSHGSAGYWFPDYHVFGIANGNTLQVQAPDGSILFERPITAPAARIRMIRSGGHICFELNENDLWSRLLILPAPPQWDGASLFATGPAGTQASFAYATFYTPGTHTVHLKDALAISEAGSHYNEITNTGRKTLLLDDLFISGDVGQWKVTPGSFLQPGCSAVITHDVEAHRQRFGKGHQVVELIGENFPGVSDNHWFSAGGASLFQTRSSQWISIIGGDSSKTGQPVDLHNTDGPWESAAPSPGVYKGNRNLRGNILLTEVAEDFMELTNLSGKPLYLDSLQITDGSQTCSLPPGTLLEPLRSIILVENLAAFRQKFGPAVRAIALPTNFLFSADTLNFSTAEEGGLFNWQRQRFTSTVNGDVSKSAEPLDVWNSSADWTASAPNPGIVPGIFSKNFKNLKLTETGGNYVELTNFDSRAFSLEGLSIQGESTLWSIPSGFRLAPGCSIILVSNVAAFQQRWGAGIPAAPLSGAQIYPYFDDAASMRLNGVEIAFYNPGGSNWDESKATPGYFVRPPSPPYPMQADVDSFDTIEGANIWFSVAENYEALGGFNGAWNVQGPATVSVSRDWPDAYGIEDKRLLRVMFPKAGIYDVRFNSSFHPSGQPYSASKQVAIARPDDLDRFSTGQLRSYWKVYNAGNVSQPRDDEASYSVTRVPGKLDMDTLRPLPFPRAEVGVHCAPRIMRPLPGLNCSIQVNLTSRFGHFVGLYACSRGYSGAQYAFGWEGGGVVVYRSLSQENSTPAEVFRQAVGGQGLRIRATNAGLVFQVRDTSYDGTGEWITVWTDPGETTLSEAGPSAASLAYTYNFGQWSGGAFDNVLVIDESTLPENLKLTGVGPDFYELTNVCSTALDLTHLKFADGASISSYAPLAAGRSILLVENADQFLQTHSTSAQIVEMPGLVASSNQTNLFTLTAPGRLQPFLTFTPSTLNAAQMGSFELINVAGNLNHNSNWRSTSKSPGAWQQDLDGDGVPDSTETRFGTNPNDPHSRHYLHASRNGSGRPLLAWPTAVGQTYHIEYCDALAQPWQILATVSGQGSEAQFQDTTTPTPPRRFYRVRAP